MGAYNIDKKTLNIVKQSGTDQYYLEWSLTNTQKKKVISKTYTKSDGKKKGTKTKKFSDAIDGFVVIWYYQIKIPPTNSTTWYPYKSSSFAGSKRDTKADLFTPPAQATRFYAKIKPVSKEFVLNEKTNKTDKWFDADYTSSAGKGYEGYPDAPSIELFTIKGTKMTVRVKFEVNGGVDKIKLNILKDNTTQYTGTQQTVSAAQSKIGYYTFDIDLSTISEFSDAVVGSYQVMAAVATSTGGNKWTWNDGWSSLIDTQPIAPTLSSCEATAEDKIKVTWEAVDNIETYKIEYVADSEDYFDSGLMSSVTVGDSAVTYLLTGLSVGTTYYIRVKSVNDSDESEPSNVMSAVLATKPAVPTTWSSTTVAAITNDISTTEKEYLYWVHNSKDGSAQRSSELEFVIAGTTYYLLVTNTNVDTYGNLVDKTMQLELWSQMLYTTEGANTTEAGTVYTLFKNGGGDSIKWKVRTKGIYADYSDWSVERTIKAYIQPTLSLTVTKDGSALVDNILTGYPFLISGSTTPANQTPISFYVTISSNESYDDVNEYGDDVTVVSQTDIFAKYIDLSSLALTIGAADADLKPGVSYILKVICYMNSGLSAEASYIFTTSWTESADVPDADVDYDPTYRYADIRPYCQKFIGNSEITTDPNSYFGTGITGTSTDETIFPSSGVTSAVVGDLYFNNSLDTVYICTVAGDASTAKWIYKTTLDYSDAVNWYSGNKITTDNIDAPVTKSNVTTAVLNDYYFNTDTGDIFRCVTPGAKTVAMWQYVWNAFFQVSENILLSVYRKNSDGTYTAIAEGIDNAGQSADSAIYVRDKHPSFNSCVYRIVAQNTKNSGISYIDLNQSYGESSIIIQWDEVWLDTTSDPKLQQYQGSLLELPANIKLSDSSSPDVTLAEYIGRTRPVSYYGTQRGESLKLSCEFPKEDNDTLSTLRKLMVYSGDVYIREPSGLGYWANVTVSYDRNFKEVTVPVSIEIKPVEGGE